MPSSYYDPTEYKFSVAPGIEPALIVNGYRLKRPAYFKNKAHARGFEIALVLASKKPAYTYRQRMGDITICKESPVIMVTSECIDVIMFDVPKEIQLDIEVKEPEKSARDAMRFVPDFFEEGIIKFDKYKDRKRTWYLEILK